MHQKIKYPKLTLLLGIYLVTFFIFSFAGNFFESLLVHFGPVGILLAGAMYTYSFTGSIGTGSFLLLAKTYSPLTLAIIGGIAAGLADVSILKFFKKYNFSDELSLLGKEKFFVKFFSLFRFLKTKLFLTIAGFITIASPLPDELGILFIERGKMIKTEYLFILGLLANGIGIYLVALTA